MKKFKGALDHASVCPSLNDLDLSSIVVSTKKNDSKDLNNLIRIAKFSKNPKEKEIARKNLVRLYKQAVEGQAKSYVRKGTAGKGVSISPSSSLMNEAKHDIVSAAWEGFFRALELYDVNSGVPFRGYFMFHIQHRCTKEFYTLTDHLSGTDNLIWRKFLSWCGKQKRSRIKNLSWEESLNEASNYIGCKPDALNEIVRARSWNSGGVVSFVEHTKTTDEKKGADVIGIQTECDSYVWENSNRFRTPGEIDKGETWDEIELFFKKVGLQGENLTRHDVAKMLVKKFDSPTPVSEILKQQMFVSLFREHISRDSNETILAKKNKVVKDKNVNNRVTNVNKVKSKISVKRG